MPVGPSGGLFSGAVLGALADSGVAVHGRRVHRASSYVRCEDDPKPKPVTIPAPACLESGENCSGLEDLQMLQKFAGAVDDSMEEDLKMIKKARETFLRRACDYQYAEAEDKGEILQNAYGPKGPLVPQGSYLFELRRWADATYMLHRQCLRGMGGCASLMEYLKDHPEDDMGPGGVHGLAGSKVYTELRKACEVGKSRSPVPNDGPVWCQLDTGLCEQKSCRKWWRKIHYGKNSPWIDDRLEYDGIAEACHWINHTTPTSRELNKYQDNQVQEKVLAEKIQFCRPKWIDGYCEETKDSKPRFGQCTLEDGRWCKNGKVEVDSENDVTGGWKEKFKEKAVTAEKGNGPHPLLTVLLGQTAPTSISASSSRGTPASNVKRPHASRSRYGDFF